MIESCCTFPIVLSPNGIPFRDESIGKVNLQSKFGLMQRDSKSSSLVWIECIMFEVNHNWLKTWMLKHLKNSKIDIVFAQVWFYYEFFYASVFYEFFYTSVFLYIFLCISFLWIHWLRRKSSSMLGCCNQY